MLHEVVAMLRELEHRALVRFRGYKRCLICHWAMPPKIMWMVPSEDGEYAIFICPWCMADIAEEPCP